jgi:hypothetical protein
MAQRRSAAVAFDYVAGLSPETKANCWSIAESAGHEGWGRMQALLGSLTARIPVTVQGSPPRASGELTMPLILPDALTGDRRSRGSMTTCLGGRWPHWGDLDICRYVTMPGSP